MRKKMIMFLILTMAALCGTISVQASDAWGTVTEDFEECTSADDVLSGALFASYTDLKPVLVSGINGTDLKISSKTDQPNTLYMTSVDFDKGTLSAAFSMRADSAPKRNWGYASHIVLRYDDTGGETKEETLAEFAYNVIRVKADGKETSASGFSPENTYRFSFDISKLYRGGQYILRVEYSINSNSYACEYVTNENGSCGLGFSSYEANALYIEEISARKIIGQRVIINENFNDYSDCNSFIPGRIFDLYTKSMPEIFGADFGKCLRISSSPASDNILTTKLINKDALKFDFEAGADLADGKNWGTSSKVIIRYDNAGGITKNEGIIDFADNLVRTRINGVIKSAASFEEDRFYRVKMNINKKYKNGKYVFVIDYEIEDKSFTAELETCADGKIGIGFHSIYGNSLLIKSISLEYNSKVYYPSKGEISEAFTGNCTDNSHPRIMMDSKRLSFIKSEINDDESFKKWYKNVKSQADKALAAPVSKYELRDGERLLYVSRDVFSNAVYPAFVYLIEGGDKYKQRVWEELKSAADFRDWHPAHFLDTAEMTYAFAICYDWLYDDWSDEQRKVIKNAIISLGLDAAMEAYNGTAQYDESVFGAYHNRTGWKNDKSNWGIVCNGGIAAGALAIMDSENKDYCAEVIYNALIGLESPLSLYSDDGAWIEGISYWQYATNYLCYMISSLKNTLGTTYGFLNKEGIKNSAGYLIGHTGTKAMFNYGDCGEGIVSTGALFYLADALNMPQINACRLNTMDKFGLGGGLQDIIYYNPDAEAAASPFNNIKFDSVGVVSSKSSDKSVMANYIAVKGGKIGVSHGDLDAGSFVIDALGERWACDFGTDKYTLDGYFDWSKRINYYRKRAEGHSAIVINPDGGADQKIGSEAKITRFISGENGMCAVMDLSEVYGDHVVSAERTVAVVDDYGKFIIQDEIKAKDKSDIYWFMQTGKNASVSQDKKSIVLSGPGKKRMLMVLQSDCDMAEFAVSDAKPLEASPNPAGQAVNSGYKRISVLCKNVDSLTLRVTFIPYYEGFEPVITTLRNFSDSNSLISDLGDFSTPETAGAKGILLDGKALEDFEENIYYYNAEAQNGYLPEITVQSDYDAQIKYGEISEITLKDPSGKLQDGKYYIVFSNVINNTSLNVKISENGEIISNIKEGNITVDAHYYDKEADIYIAQYDSDGALKSIYAGGNAALNINKKDTVRVFVWEKGGFQKPVIPAENVK